MVRRAARAIVMGFVRRNERVGIFREGVEVARPILSQSPSKLID